MRGGKDEWQGARVRAMRGGKDEWQGARVRAMRGGKMSGEGRGGKGNGTSGKAAARDSITAYGNNRPCATPQLEREKGGGQRGDG